MTNQAPPSTFLPEALHSKSLVYIRRAFRAKKTGDVDEYQLWASLALELLGKAALAKISPALIADPAHHESLFAACGVHLGTDFKTISAKTLFSRLPHISKGFDPQVQKFCEQVALQRNAELHSGESPFLALLPAVWDQRYWYAISVLLSAQGRTLEEWLGAEEAAAPKQVLEDAQHAISQAIAERIARAKTSFEKNTPNPARRAELVQTSASIRPWEHYKEFSTSNDGFEKHLCPACGATGILGGSLWEEVESEEQDPDDPTIEMVDLTYLSEEFRCFTCRLTLEGRREVHAAQLPEEFYHQEERERKFEPEYGND
ncbi:hypothetical protein ACG04R_16580 [Roseateles sp. BYS78W]|uniref:Uncharacterized protein n=1 Tax=Pelomonas candidula TaxID=3299025 RepID=A0ABW7HER1_9BURK